MNPRCFLPDILLVAIAVAPVSRAADDQRIVPPASDWQTLFNGRDLSNWDTYIASSEGDAPLVANRDPKGIFAVSETDGAPAIHVRGEQYGAITTRKEFENVHIRVECKWGPGRWAPRTTVARDSGILYCGTGQPNPHTGWLTSIENNVMEKGIGQWWSVNGAIIDTDGEWITPENELSVPYKKEGSGEKNIVWRKGGRRIESGPGNGITPPFDVEEVFGNWNTVEVVFWGGQCLHLLNGHVNLVAVNPRYEEGGVWRPLERGKIQLQAEGAEVFYRKVEARPLYALPAGLLEHAISPAGPDDAGFTPLLADDALAKWRQCGPGRFNVADGVATGEGGMGLWWFGGADYRNFVLRGEFKQEQALADSGIFVRFPDPADDPWSAVRKGHEIEIGDPNPGNEFAPTASVYPHQPALANASRPVGEWNTYEIVCTAQNYSVRLNDRLVTTWTDTSARTSGGFVGLQNYNDGKTVRHRRLRIKALP